MPGLWHCRGVRGKMDIVASWSAWVETDIYGVHLASTISRYLQSLILKSRFINTVQMDTHMKLDNPSS
jgi:hypothetical protein